MPLLCKITLKFIIGVRNRSSYSLPGSQEGAEEFLVLLMFHSRLLLLVLWVVFNSGSELYPCWTLSKYQLAVVKVILTVPGGENIRD